MAKLQSRPMTRVNGALLAATAIVLASAGMLAGCGSFIGGLPVVGEPAGTPRAPAVQPDFPSVGVKPSQPAEKPMTAAERQKVETDLKAASTLAADEKRAMIQGFDEKLYVQANPDIIPGIKAGRYKSGLEHWLRYGRVEKRPLRPTDKKPPREKS